MTGSARPGASTGAILPPLAIAPLDSTVLPNGILVRIVAAQPPAQLLTTLYGQDASAALTALVETDPVLQRDLGGIHLVQADDWPVAPGAGWILAAFVRAPSPDTATRFSDGSYGVWYGAETLSTAQAEVGHHLRAYLSRTSAKPDALPRGILHAAPNLACPVIDIRSPAAVPSGVLSPDNYRSSQPFGAACRAAQNWGIVWPSVRRRGGICVAALRPPVLDTCDIAGLCHALWDGQSLTWGP